MISIGWQENGAIENISRCELHLVPEAETYSHDPLRLSKYDHSAQNKG